MAQVLIVDDNPNLREGIGSYLSRQGHQPWLAGGVAEAVDLARRQAPDLILSDLIMGDGTGLSLRQELNKLNLKPAPYFILLTGHPTPDNAAEACAGGVDLYLTKPVQLPALALAVDGALRRRPSEAAPARTAAEAFYHESFLALNPVLPRLLMLLEGRYGGLGAEQSAALGALFESWRGQAWAMANFQGRLAAPPESAPLARARWSGPVALQRLLERLAPDLENAQLRVDVSREPRLPLALVHGPTAEALMEALVLRLAAFSAPGAMLFLEWKAGPERLSLTLSSDQPHQDLDAVLMRHVALLPPAQPLLDEAGVRVRLCDAPGPWTLSFERESSRAR